MRFLVRIQLPVEQGNKMIKDPKFIQKMGNILQNNQGRSSLFL
jgi:hypothetical protein